MKFHIRTTGKAIDAFARLTGLIPRRVKLDQVIEFELLEVKPLPRPTGSIFGLRFKYEKGSQ